MYSHHGLICGVVVAAVLRVLELKNVSAGAISIPDSEAVNGAGAGSGAAVGSPDVDVLDGSLER